MTSCPSASRATSLIEHHPEAAYGVGVQRVGLTPAHHLRTGQGYQSATHHRAGPFVRVESRTGAVAVGTGLFCCRPLSQHAGVAIRSMAPFPVPAHQTGRAGLPHPAFGQGFILSLTDGRAAIEMRSEFCSTQKSPGGVRVAPWLHSLMDARSRSQQLGLPCDLSSQPMFNESFAWACNAS